MDQSGDLKPMPAVEFIVSIFEQDLADTTKYDPDVVSVVKKHLGTTLIHSRAGVRIAEELVALAKTRAKGEGQ